MSVSATIRDAYALGLGADHIVNIWGFDIGLSASPITFTHNDHRPTSSCLIQEWKDGKFQGVERVDIKKRWPNKWELEWHGW